MTSPCLTALVSCHRFINLLFERLVFNAILLWTPYPTRRCPDTEIKGAANLRPVRCAVTDRVQGVIDQKDARTLYRRQTCTDTQTMRVRRRRGRKIDWNLRRNWRRYRTFSLFSPTPPPSIVTNHLEAEEGNDLSQHTASLSEAPLTVSTVSGYLRLDLSTYTSGLVFLRLRLCC